jgi:hypothetical protein
MRMEINLFMIFGSIDTASHICCISSPLGIVGNTVDVHILEVSAVHEMHGPDG